MNEVLKAIRERRSVRAYRPEQIKDEELNAILEAGTYAPTGMGKQSPKIVVVQDPETIQKLSRLNAGVMGNDGDPFYGAPLCWWYWRTVPVPPVWRTEAW